MMHTHRSIRSHVETHHGRSTHRVHHILGRADGGVSDKAEDTRMIKRAMGEHDAQLHPGKHTRIKLRDGGMADGGASARRLDRGGRSKGHKGSHVIVNVSPGQEPARPMPVPVPAAGGAPMPPPRPPMAPPGMMPPGVPPTGPGLGGMPPGMPPMRADGGRLSEAGEAHGKKLAFKETAGARSGMGRLQKMRMPQHSERAAGD